MHALVPATSILLGLDAAKQNHFVRLGVMPSHTVGAHGQEGLVRSILANFVAGKCILWWRLFVFGLP